MRYREPDSATALLLTHMLCSLLIDRGRDRLLAALGNTTGGMVCVLVRARGNV